MTINAQSLPIPYHPSQEVIDSTKIKTFMSCPRKFFYEYLLGWRSAFPSNHLVFGKAAHLALEHLYIHGFKAQSVVDAYNIFEEDYRMTFPESTDEIFAPKTPGNFLNALVEYVKHYPQDHSQYEVYKTEFGGTVSIDEGMYIAFKIDTIIRDRTTNEYSVLEHKTGQGNYVNDDLYPIQHAMGPQVGTYTHVLNCIVPPERTSGVIINLLNFKKSKAGGYIFKRFPCFLSNPQMNDWIHSMRKWIRMIQAEVDILREEDDLQPIMQSFPKNGTSCTEFFRPCPYLDLCQGRQNPLQTLDRMPADMEVSFWNPLEEELREVLTL